MIYRKYEFPNEESYRTLIEPLLYSINTLAELGTLKDDNRYYVDIIWSDDTYLEIKNYEVYPDSKNLSHNFMGWVDYGK